MITTKRRLRLHPDKGASRWKTTTATTQLLGRETPWARLVALWVLLRFLSGYTRREVTLPGQSHRWFIPVRSSILPPRLSLSLSRTRDVQALFSSRRLTTRPRNIIFTPRGRPFSKHPFLSMRFFAACTRYDSRRGSPKRVTRTRGFPICARERRKRYKSREKCTLVNPQ